MTVAAKRRARRERLPVAALVLAGVAIAFFALPFLGLLWRAPWRSLGDVLGSSTLRDAL